jgi:flagellar hook-basal body complex protein FliE
LQKSVSIRTFPLTQQFGNKRQFNKTRNKVCESLQFCETNTQPLSFAVRTIIKMSDLERFFTSWSARVEAYQPAHSDLKELEEILNKIVEHRDGSKQNVMTKCVPVPNKKQKSRKNQLKKIDQEVEKEFWEGNKRLFAKVASFIAVNLNRDANHGMVKIDTVKHIFAIVSQIEEVAAAHKVKELNFCEVLKNAISDVIENRMNETVVAEATTEDEVCLNSLLRLIKSAKHNIEEAVKVFESAFA